MYLLNGDAAHKHIYTPFPQNFVIGKIFYLGKGRKVKGSLAGGHQGSMGKNLRHFLEWKKWYFNSCIAFQGMCIVKTQQTVHLRLCVLYVEIILPMILCVLKMSNRQDKLLSR